MALRLRLATFNLNNLGRRDNPDPATFQAKLEYIRMVIRHLDADVLVLNELREVEALDELIDPIADYPVRLMGDSALDRRELHSAILSRLKLKDQGQWHEYDAVLPGTAPDTGSEDSEGVAGTAVLTRLRFSRPIPWACLELDNGEHLFVAAVHLKSWRTAGEDLPQVEDPRRRLVLGRGLSIVMRNSEAVGLRCHLDSIMETGTAQHCAVMGDCNDSLNSTTVGLVTGLETEDFADLAGNETRRLFPVGWWMPEGMRFSYVRHGRRELFDHILISRELSLQLVDTRAEAHLLEPVHSRRNDPGTGYPRSDHAPVWAEFRLRQGFGNSGGNHV